MGAAVIPFIGQIIVSVLVSKVATKVATKLGFSDGFAQLIGMGAGIYAGALAGQSMGAKPSTGVQAPELTEVADLGGGGSLAPSDIVGPGGPGARAGGGMLDYASQPPGTLPSGGIVPQGSYTPPPAGNTITPPTSAPPPPAPTTPTYWEKLFSPERVADMAAGGIKSMGDYQAAKEDREYPEKVAKEDAQGWVERGSGELKQIQLPSVGAGYLSSQQQ